MQVEQKANLRERQCTTWKPLLPVHLCREETRDLRMLVADQCLRLRLILPLHVLQLPDAMPWQGKKSKQRRQSIRSRFRNRLTIYLTDSPYRKLLSIGLRRSIWCLVLLVGWAPFHSRVQTWRTFVPSPQPVQKRLTSSFDTTLNNFTICRLTNSNGWLTISHKVDLQTAALWRKPAPGNQRGTWRTGSKLVDS